MSLDEASAKAIGKTSSCNKYTIFVYGTLKRGFTNYKRYLGVAEAAGKAKFLGCAETSESFLLASRATRGPVLMEPPSLEAGCQRAGCQRVKGEVYSVDDSTFQAMDLLEGVDTGNYYRRLVSVCMSGSAGPAEEVEAFAYFHATDPALLCLPSCDAYTVEHHEQYQPRPMSVEILQLCAGVAMP
eukprot:gnl/TRDRNA2_/TRDRNA2_174992_c0_seq2.p1 gnl/TRDRNA2_/TRDRNA2_174992_c0~~gnl/TRDRNA2_/TRDRNA2_174992_c0_seq2.p1  ORF type:complete len:185 (-),score=27.71 gnl/TRDRNA2_/TRDRNA2_174992_c0_seq2:102-656(-)